MKKLLIGASSLLIIGFGLHVERINPNPFDLVTFDLVTINEAEARRGGARRGGGHRGGRRAHRSVNVNVNRRHRHGGTFVAGAVVGAAVVVVGSRHRHLPHGCTNYDYYGTLYYHCDGAYYQPVYDGPDVVYVAVDKP